MTLKQENRIYRRMLKEMTGKKKLYSTLQEGFICDYQYGLCRAYAKITGKKYTTINDISNLTALSNFNPNLSQFAYWYNSNSPEENYNARLTALCFAIAMTE